MHTISDDFENLLAEVKKNILENGRFLKSLSDDYVVEEENREISGSEANEDFEEL